MGKCEQYLSVIKSLSRNILSVDSCVSTRNDFVCDKSYNSRGRCMMFLLSDFSNNSIQWHNSAEAFDFYTEPPELVLVIDVCSRLSVEGNRCHNFELIHRWFSIYWCSIYFKHLVTDIGLSWIWSCIRICIRIDSKNYKNSSFRFINKFWIFALQL